jgi:hypothetical protein
MCLCLFLYTYTIFVNKFRKQFYPPYSFTNIFILHNKFNHFTELNNMIVYSFVILNYIWSEGVIGSEIAY